MQNAHCNKPYVYTKTFLICLFFSTWKTHFYQFKRLHYITFSFYRLFLLSFKELSDQIGLIRLCEIFETKAFEAKGKKTDVEFDLYFGLRQHRYCNLLELTYYCVQFNKIAFIHINMKCISS